MRSPLPRVHAVTDERIARRPDLDRLTARLSQADGTLAVHARGRALSGLEHYDLAVRLAAHPRLRLFVNDRVDVALATDAAGVHLPEGGLPVEAVRRVGGRRAWWIGRSVHSVPQARAAQAEGADYLLVGPVFTTATHPGAAPLDGDAIRAVAALGLPVIAIGGVTPERARDLGRAGVYGIAAIRALWDVPDPAAAARAFLEALELERQ